jgi:hypothetical protein
MDEILAVIRHAARTGHDLGCVRSSSSFGASGCASKRRWHSPGATSTTGADRARLLRQRRPQARGRHGRWAVGAAESLARREDGATGRPTRGRPWSGAAVRQEFRRIAARTGSGAGSRRRSCATPTRLSSAASASRSTSSSGNSGTPISARRRSVARDRLRGDHRHRSACAGADDVRQRRAATLIAGRRAGAPPALPLRRS